MYKGKNILAIIPARGGSKGLPRKNILPLLGEPLISRTIRQSLAGKYFDKVIVNTDDLEIAEVSIKSGAEVPFIRPVELATDKSKASDVIIYTIEWFEKKSFFYDLVMWLQPTSPLRTTDDINNAIELFFLKNAEAIVSVCKTEHHPYWTNVLPEDGCMKKFLREEIINTNRQDLEDFYRLNGSIYLIDTNFFKKNKSFFGERTFAYVMPSERSIDIDYKSDFDICEFILKKDEKSNK